MLTITRNRPEGIGAAEECAGIPGNAHCRFSPLADQTQALTQSDIDWLLARGVKPEAIANPQSIRTARGERDSIGRFHHDTASKSRWLAFEETDDTVYWRASIGELATEHGVSFCLGEFLLGNPYAHGRDRPLKIFASPLDWLRHGRLGIVVIRWDWCFDRLRDLSAVTIAPELLETYDKAMRPRRMPALSILGPEGPGS